MFSVSSGFSILGRLSMVAALAAGACQAGPGISCGDGYCGVGYECLAEAGAWLCVSAADGGRADGGAGGLCGDGVVDTAAGERCDDGNQIADDGCDERCQVEALMESEPNEDGSPNIGAPQRGNDFDTANADGPYDADTIIAATLVPIGDEDVFAVTNRGAAPALVRFETYDAGAGLGAPCTAIHTKLFIRDAGGRALAENVNAAGLCASVERTIEPGETVYAHVFERNDVMELPMPGYWLVIDFR